MLRIWDAHDAVPRLTMSGKSPRAKRAYLLKGPTEIPPAENDIQIVTTSSGDKLAVGGTRHTATFIYERMKPLAGEIRFARGLWMIARERGNPAPILAPDRFPQIALLCVQRDIDNYIAKDSTTPLQAAQAIMEGLFRGSGYKPESIARLGRCKKR